MLGGRAVDMDELMLVVYGKLLERQMVFRVIDRRWIDLPRCTVDVYGGRLYVYLCAP